MNRTLSALLLSTLGLAACDKSPTTAVPAQPPSMTAETRDAIGERSNAVCTATSALHHDVTAFLDGPSDVTLTRARESWSKAHDSYLLLADDYRLADLQPPQIAENRDSLDAWPPLPGYLDQVPGYPNSGLVYSEVPLTPDFLRQEHQSTDFYYLTEGFHPLEFMLWGNPGETLASQVLKFTDEPNNADQLDIAGRRQDLTRLISIALKNTSSQLCTPEEKARLAAGLAKTGRFDQQSMTPSLVGHEPPNEDVQPEATESEESGQ